MQLLSEEWQQRGDERSLFDRIIEVKTTASEALMLFGRSDSRSIEQELSRFWNETLEEIYDKLTYRWPITARWRIDTEYAMQMASIGASYDNMVEMDIMAMEMFNIKLPQYKTKEEIEELKLRFQQKKTRKKSAAHYDNIIKKTQADTTARILRHKTSAAAQPPASHPDGAKSSSSTSAPSKAPEATPPKQSMQQTTPWREPSDPLERAQQTTPWRATQQTTSWTPTPPSSSRNADAPWRSSQNENQNDSGWQNRDNSTWNWQTSSWNSPNSWNSQSRGWNWQNDGWNRR